MQLAWLSLALITTVGYHLVMKVTPAAAESVLVAGRDLGLGAAVFLACFALAPDGPTLREGLKPLNWTALALTLMVVGLDVGIPDALPLGVRRKPRPDRHAVRRRAYSRGRGHCPVPGKDQAANLVGIALCVIGLWLINRK